ncbi:MAG: 50S ribosomal protein L32 [Oscillospiraceae bacterium]
MAVPKGKVSKQRRNKRRSSVWKLAAPGLVACPKRGAASGRSQNAPGVRYL